VVVQAGSKAVKVVSISSQMLWVFGRFGAFKDADMRLLGCQRATLLEQIFKLLE
jgi:hypothetical protein